MNRTHSYDDTNEPPPPPWWQGPLVAVLFFILMAALALFCSSCSCTLSCQPDIPRAIEIIESLSTK